MKATMLMAMIILAFGVANKRCSCAVVQFIFGDSLSDVGNNNYLTKSLARAATPWYGIDFGTGMPNGRFTNGRTAADIVGDKLGLPRPPAYMDPTLDEDMILKNGVNYASGGGGILNETASLFIQRFSLYKQIELFQGTQELIRKKIGNGSAQKFFSEARYIVAMGSNDYINNFLLPVYTDSWKYSGVGFTNYLISTIEDQLKILHSLGARQLVFFGLGPMGCIPLQRVLTSSGDCQESTNTLSLNFNKAASQLVAKLSSSLPNATFQFGDAYAIFQDMIDRPHAHGLNNSDSPCCSIGKIKFALTCTPLSSLCTDRSKFLFWDEYHPTDKANEVIADAIIKKLGYKTVNNSAS